MRLIEICASLAFILSTAVGLNEAKAHSALSCSAAISAKSEEKIFDPEKVLKSKGVDPDLVTFEFKYGHDRYILGEILAKYEGRPIFQIEFKNGGPDKVIALTSFVGREKDSKLKGTGLGSTTYLVAAYLLYKKQGVILSSDVLNGHRPFVSKPAQAVWERFAELGYARLVTDYGDFMYQFDFKNLSPNQIAVINQFQLSRTRM